MSEDQSLVSALLSGKAPRQARLAAAKALIPLTLQDQLRVLIKLTADPDKIVNSEANATLEAIPEERILPILRSEGTEPAILDYFCFDLTRGTDVLHAVAMNHATPDKTIAELAQVADTALLETILLNQTRMIRYPLILDTILANPAASPEAIRRCNEIKTEFFVKTGQKPSVSLHPAPSATMGVEPPTFYDAEIQPIAEGIEVEVPFRPEDLGLQTQQEISTFQRIARMNTSGKVKLALLGSREERVILIRDPNRVVASSVLKSPKISEQEVEAISQMRNISEEVLRLIGNRRDWLKSYIVVRNLVRNPKTPVALSLRLMSRLLDADIRLLARDKSIPEMVRRNADRYIKSKSPSH